MKTTETQIQWNNLTANQQERILLMAEKKFHAMKMRYKKPSWLERHFPGLAREQMFERARLTSRVPG